MEFVVIGTSENIEAEYGSRADEVFTIALFYDNDCQSVEGYNSKEAALIALREYHEVRIERMF